jgi:hypothetical protein
MPGVAALTPARFTLGLSADFRTIPGLICFYSYSGRIAVTWRTGGRVTQQSRLTGRWETRILGKESCLISLQIVLIHRHCTVTSFQVRNCVPLCVG